MGVRDYALIWNNTILLEYGFAPGGLTTITATVGTKTITVIDIVGRTATFEINVTELVLGDTITSSDDLHLFLSSFGEEEGEGSGCCSEHPIQVLPIVMEDMGAEQWLYLLEVIGNHGKYIELDLSSCGNLNSIGGEYGVEYIVSIIMPDAVMEFYMEGFYSGNYTDLKTISGNGVVSINEYSFSGMASLESVSFPYADGIGGNAFYGCTGLTNLYVPNIGYIYPKAFQNTGTASLTITMGESPPYVNTNEASIFGDVAQKMVTVKIPNGTAANYNGEWQAAFIGENTGIHLIIQELEE